MTVRKAFAERFKDLRTDRKLSQNDIAFPWITLLVDQISKNLNNVCNKGTFTAYIITISNIPSRYKLLLSIIVELHCRSYANMLSFSYMFVAVCNNL